MHPNSAPAKHPPARNLATLEDEITELAAHLNAATYRLLVLIREFDQRGGWNGEGLKSCAHWLNWKCGIALGAAREKVRVAHALADLPDISSALRGGQVSYSKVRAMTRVATPQNEDYLLMIAAHGTAAHVERLVRHYRRVKRSEALEQANRVHALRECSWYIDDDGSYVLNARLSPEQGARVAQALNAALGEIREEQFNAAEDVSPEPSSAATTPIAARRADALERLADNYLASEARAVTGGERCTVHIHTDINTLRADGDGGETRLDNLLLLCRHHHRLVHEGGFGLTLDVTGEAVFSAPDSRAIRTGPETRFRGNVFALVTTNRRELVEIDAGTLVPDWQGEPMDDSLAVAGLVRRK